jgi:hypothetical protein
MNTRQRPSDVMRELVTLLRAQGLTRLYWSACAAVGVVSVAQDVTVWSDGRQLRWRIHGDETVLPASDTENAATRLAELVRGQQS